MDSLTNQVRLFVKERDWDQFHSPKNLAIGLSIEASELLEIFLWLSEEESKELPKNKIDNLKEEIGDILIYLINLADKFDLDPIECARNKIEVNKKKYPIDLAIGSAKKYTEYE